MGFVKQMWMDAVDQIAEDYAAAGGGLSREDAVLALGRHGIDCAEAHQMLDAAEA